MAKYLRTSKRLQRLRLSNYIMTGDDRQFPWPEEMMCCLLPAIQESESLKELDIDFPLTAGPSNLALKNMLTHTQSLRTLSLSYPEGLHDDIAVAAARSGLKNNTTLRELTLEFSRGTTTISPILTSLRDHPLLRRLCLRGSMVNLTGLDTVLLSDSSKNTELDIHSVHMSSSPMMGLTPVLRALARRPTLTKLRVCCCPLDRDEARLLQMALHKTPS
jgi:hypothetical protein